MNDLEIFIETPALAWAPMMANRELNAMVLRDQLEPVDVGGDQQALALTEAGARDFVSKVLNHPSVQAAFATAGGPLRAICDEDKFDFCEKYARLGRLETAKLLAEYLKSGLVGAAGLAVILSDPTLLTPLVAVLVVIALKDLCRCWEK